MEKQVALSVPRKDRGGESGKLVERGVRHSLKRQWHVSKQGGKYGTIVEKSRPSRDTRKQEGVRGWFRSRICKALKKNKRSGSKRVYWKEEGRTGKPFSYGEKELFDQCLGRQGGGKTREKNRNHCAVS